MMPTESPKRLWITWETQRRNRELAGAFNCKFLELDYSNEGRLVRFVKSASKTVGEVVSLRGGVVFAQYPSLYLVCLLGVIRSFVNFTFVVDAHNIALEEYSSGGLRGVISRFVFERCDFIIVTNTSLLSDLKDHQHKALVLPDKIPSIHNAPPPAIMKDKEGLIVTLIASYAADEPIEDFIKGFIQANLGADVTLFITGKKSRAGDLVEYEADNIVFTDFLTEKEFNGLICNSDMLADLTTRDGCLVCGAYEALAVGVPALLSDKVALRATFPSGTIFAENEIASYSEALRQFPEQLSLLREEVKQMKKEFDQTWAQLFRIVEERVSEFRKAS